jgi:anti-sigma B factor antagonist
MSAKPWSFATQLDDLGPQLQGGDRACPGDDHRLDSPTCSPRRCWRASKWLPSIASKTRMLAERLQLQPAVGGTSTRSTATTSWIRSATRTTAWHKRRQRRSQGRAESRTVLGASRWNSYRRPPPTGATRLTVDGDLTIYHADEIKQRLIEGVRANAVLELDLSHVGEMDTAGLQLLALAKRESERLEQRVRIVGHSPRCAKSSNFSTWWPSSATRW